MLSPLPRMVKLEAQRDCRPCEFSNFRFDSPKRDVSISRIVVIVLEIWIRMTHSFEPSKDLQKKHRLGAFFVPILLSFL